MYNFQLLRGMLHRMFEAQTPPEQMLGKEEGEQRNPATGRCSERPPATPCVELARLPDARGEVSGPERNSQGEDPSTFKGYSQGKDPRTSNGRSQKVERWRVQKKRKEQRWKKKKEKEEKGEVQKKELVEKVQREEKRPQMVS